MASECFGFICGGEGGLAMQHQTMVVGRGATTLKHGVENVNSVMGKKSKKDLGAKDKHLFWAKTECGLVLSSVKFWEIISKEKGVTTGGYMCRHCQSFWKQGRGATRLVQIIGRRRGRKVSRQLIMDEPPEALYNHLSRTASSTTRGWSQWPLHVMNNLTLDSQWLGSGFLTPMTAARLGS